MQRLRRRRWKFRSTDTTSINKKASLTGRLLYLRRGGGSLAKTYNNPAELSVIIFEVSPFLDGLLTKVREYRTGKLTDKQFVDSLKEIESHIDAGIKTIQRLKFKEKEHGYASFRIIGAYRQYMQGLALLVKFTNTKNGDELSVAAEHIGKSTEILNQCRKLLS